ncbi:hypothetical protein Tco_0110676 [Tanacetum coccineum]|uniref:Uncharacterized protein n=1 Tax=Tanacetum coccineum TaxID=301880 RepID=A0ABQ4WN12_9ASTR
MVWALPGKLEVSSDEGAFATKMRRFFFINEIKMIEDNRSSIDHQDCRGVDSTRGWHFVEGKAMEKLMASVPGKRKLLECHFEEGIWRVK